MFVHIINVDIMTQPIVSFDEVTKIRRFVLDRVRFWFATLVGTGGLYIV